MLGQWSFLHNLPPKKKEEPVSMIPTLDTGQQDMAALLRRLMQGAGSTDWQKNLQRFLLGAGITPSKPLAEAPRLDIPGMPTTPLPSEGTFGMGFGAGSASGDRADPFGGPLGNEVLAAMRSALSGKVSDEYFKSTVAGPLGRQFREDIAPTIRESFVGPGTFWGGAKGEAVQKEGMRLQDALASARGGMANEALSRALKAALGYMDTQGTYDMQRADIMSRNYDSYLDARSQDYNTWAQLTGGAYGDWLDARSQDYSTWQGARSSDLNAYINAFMQANPSSADTMQAILQYLNTPTQLAYQNPEYIPQAIRDEMEKAGTNAPTQPGAWS